MAISAGVEAGGWPRHGAADAAPPNTRPAPDQPRLFQALLQQLEAGWMPGLRINAVAAAPADGPVAVPPMQGLPMAPMAPSHADAPSSTPGLTWAGTQGTTGRGHATGATGGPPASGPMPTAGLPAPGGWPATPQHLSQARALQGGAYELHRMGGCGGGADATLPAVPPAAAHTAPVTPQPAMPVATSLTTPALALKHSTGPGATADNGPLATAAQAQPPAPPPPAGRAPLWLTGPSGQLTVAVWMPGLQPQDAAQLSRSLRHEAQRHGQTLAAVLLNGRLQPQTGDAPNPPME